MSDSKRDRRGKRIAGEIFGRASFKVVGDRVVAVGGGEEVGSPIRKREAKAMASRMRRQDGRKAVRAGLSVD